MTTVLHVNALNIRRNIKREPGDRLPVVRAEADGETVYGDRAAIMVDGQPVAWLIYSPDNPRACGARVWIETEHDVVVMDA
jgi:hypothetical protein